MSSAKAEDYIKALYQLREGDTPVAPSAVAEVLGVTTPTVTTTMKRLAERGLVAREEYKGSHLTDEGELMALETIRHHRLLELFLTERLNYDWTEVHEEADRLEHHISEKLEAEIAAVLDDPTADPHGAPIPSIDLEPIDDDLAPLSAHEEGDAVVIERVRDDDPDVLAYLDRAGVVPGTHIRVTEVAPFEMITVVPIAVDPGAAADPDAADSGRDPISLPKDVALTISVRDVDHAEDEPVPAD
jgi:DtxR family transcriptional regulator, Mn-dependent transcriptional regulator